VLNPTRTLAHLLHSLSSDVIDHAKALPEIERLDYVLARISPEDFFRAVEGVPLGYDRNDNWLENPKEARRILGPYENQFPRIMFCQYCDFIHDLLGAQEVLTSDDGQRCRLPVNGGHFIVDWSGLKVPQIETYIDRYHQNASIMVQRGGMAAIAGDHSTEIRTVFSDTTMERNERSIRVLSKLSDKYSLSVYAKAKGCIRFEVSRNKKGDYSSIKGIDDPADRFVGIIDMERQKFVAALNWQAVFDLFSGSDAYDRTHFRDFLEVIHAAFDLDHIAEIERDSLAQNRRTAFALIDKFMTEGGISQSDLSPAIRKKLLDGGVIQRQKIRAREMNGKEPQYILKSPYRDIILDLQLPRTAT